MLKESSVNRSQKPKNLGLLFSIVSCFPRTLLCLYYWASTYASLTLGYSFQPHNNLTALAQCRVGFWKSYTHVNTLVVLVTPISRKYVGYNFKAWISSLSPYFERLFTKVTLLYFHQFYYYTSTFGVIPLPAKFLKDFGWKILKGVNFVSN